MPRQNKKKYHTRLCFNEAARILKLSNKERREMTKQYKQFLKGGEIQNELDTR